ncbi:MAG: hypothetical protein K0U13_06355 [Chlamydiae bacterium]|nr:hypothetical protein [Chlamydiota bacterium]
METFPDEKAAVEAINTQTKVSGVYSYPSMCSEEKDNNVRIFLSVSKVNEASGLMIPIVISLITYFIGGLLVALIVMPMAAASYGRKLFSVALIGLVIGCMSMLPAWNWWGIPFNYTLIMIADNLIAWLLAGFVIAAFIHEKHHS